MVDYKPYEDEATLLVQLLKPHISRQDIRQAVKYSMDKRYKEVPCVLDNNYTHKNANGTLLQMANFINDKEPICTAYGVLFKKHGNKPHPLLDMIRDFTDSRDAYKKEMFRYLEAHDYVNVAKYNLAQLLAKRDNNSIYGCMGNASSILYNLYVSASITAQGRAVISTATMFFESFMANNVKFGSLEEVLHFIYNIINEKPNRRYNDCQVLDYNVSADMVFAKVMLTIGDWRKGKIKWMPDYNDAAIIYNTIKSLNQEDLNRVFYKNNLYAFMENSRIMGLIKTILRKLEVPYLSPNSVPKEIQVELDALQDLMREYVYYPHMYIDRIDRCNNMIKDVCVISDTDSTIVSFDAFYRFVFDRMIGETLNISELEIDWTSGEGKIRKVPAKELRYDFYNDEVIEMESMIKPFVLIPQNNLRYSIINIIAYISGNLCNGYVLEFTKQNHSYKEGKKCLLYLKNEFLFSRALLTDSKKNYATNQELKEGVILEQDQEHAMDIKGLPINKSTMNVSAKAALQKILYEDILMADTINQTRIIEKIAMLEKDIEKSLKEGKKDYYKPLSIKAMSSYDDPMRIQGVKASIIWNKVRGPELEAIDLNARNTIDIVKVFITPFNVGKIKDAYPEVYERFVQLFMDSGLFKDEKKKEITTLAIPTGVDTPEWVREFIDYRTIINDNIVNFPFESIGITRLGSNSINYSTIVKI